MPHELQALRSEVSANHRRVISVRLRVLEDSCLRLLDLFQPRSSVMTRRQPLPPEKAADVSRLITELTAHIARVKRDLVLEENQMEARREASAVVSAMSVDLEELYPRFLRGYGKVPPVLSQYLDTTIGECLSTLRRLQQALGTPAGPPAQPEE
jgi:hypothetical protein